MQEVLVYLLVLSAALYLAHRGWTRLKSGEGGNCPGCKGCAAAKSEPPPLIQLERRAARPLTPARRGDSLLP
ncbi:FeoB-associated Cys-rich membrane protein [Armatimonas sp.]|uniref:FeoB-associated Cys-rich membrane protein n=1 Tax=Armatimonas sp. TaxID=1872638 RepID=UPI00374FE8AA